VKITKSHLRNIIREELSYVLNEENEENEERPQTYPVPEGMNLLSSWPSDVLNDKAKYDISKFVIAGLDRRNWADSGIYNFARGKKWPLNIDGVVIALTDEGIAIQRWTHWSTTSLDRQRYSGKTVQELGDEELLEKEEELIERLEELGYRREPKLLVPFVEISHLERWLPDPSESDDLD